jgi:processing peptidase subunit beta
MASTFVRVYVKSGAKNMKKFNRKVPVSLLSARSVTHAATYEDTLAARDTKVTVLKNQLKVASEETSSQTATVGVWIDAGSRYETQKNNGVAHFIEHMAFRGTSKRSQLDLEAEAENLGVFLNAHTSREQMAFYAKCLTKDVPKAVEILADIIQNSTFSDAEVEKVKADIMKEFQEAESNLTTVVMDYLHATAYQGTSLGHPVLGTTQSVKSLSRKDLTEFVGTNYKPPRMVLAGAGGVQHDQLVQMGEKLFSGLSLTYQNEIPVLDRARFTGSEIRARDDDLPLAHVAIAVEGPGSSHGDNIALMVASTLVGSWDRTYGGGKNLSGVLASRCAQEELCHSFQSFNISYHDTGLWGAYFVADRMTIDDFIFNLQGQWMRLCSSATEFEVERAKKQLKVDLLNQLDSTTLNCEDIGRQVLYYGRRVPLAELDARIDAVSAKTVRDVCMKYVYDKCPAIASIGPVEQVPDYNRLRGGMYWLRL